jgi:STE24 endopeptidase
MPFVFLLVFALISFQGRWPEPPAVLSEPAAVLAPWALVLVFWLLAAWRTQQFCSGAALDHADHGALWRRFAQARRRQTLALTACYLGVLFGLGWGYVVKDYCDPRGLGALTELIQFSPYLLALILCWSQHFRAERASHRLALPSEPFIGPWSYLRLQIRHNLLLVVPPIIVTMVLRVFFLCLPWLEDYASAVAGVGLLVLLVALVGVPLILRVFLGLTPLPAGPLRERLEGAAGRLGLGVSNILVWNTRQTIANAMVSGTLPWMRYIVLTDLLIEKLEPDEIEAVFGHEVGHIKHHHMLLYIVFFVGSIALLTGLWKLGETVFDPAPSPPSIAVLAAGAGAAADSGPLGAFATLIATTDPDTLGPPALEIAGWVSAEVVAGPALLFLVAAYVFVVFGFLSRRCERQADLYGCRAVSALAFIGALEKVADLNGIPRRRAGWLGSWQHPSIAERVEFIERLHNQPALEAEFQRSLLKLKLSLMACLSLALVAVMALVAWRLGPDHVWDLFRVR